MHHTKSVHYRAHCFHEIEDIVTRVREVRTLTHADDDAHAYVYVLTSGRPWWLRWLSPYE